MKNIGNFLLILFFSFTIHSLYSQVTGPEETNKMIVAALTAGNSAELSKYMNSMVDLGIKGTEDTYSKNHAARILKDFFTNNPVKSVKILKQGTSNDGSQFSIGQIQAGDKTYRLYYLLKRVTANYLIQQFQIEEEN
jgi:Domain of unknown function (DUF4783)